MEGLFVTSTTRRRKYAPCKMPERRLRIVTVRSVFCRERHPASSEQKYVQHQTSSVAQATCDLELWDCHSIGNRSSDYFAAAVVSFANCSRVPISLRHPVRRVAGWSRTGIARDRTLRYHFLLLFPAASPLICCEARRDTTICRFFDGNGVFLETD